MEIIEDRGQPEINENHLPRRRKMAVAHHNNFMLQCDTNGNTRTFTRLSSLTENESNNISDGNPTSDTENENNSRDSVLWESVVLQQIQSLIKNVQVSDSLGECINRELLLNDIQSDVNANIGPKFRRKSCYNLSNNSHIQATRRQSVTSIHQQKSKSLPRCLGNSNVSGIDNFSNTFGGRRASVTNMNGRKTSIVRGSSRRQSVTSQTGVRRRSSVTRPNFACTTTGSKFRRNSLAHGVTRTESLARAYQNSIMPSIRRKSMSSNENTVHSFANAPLQRRRSSVKPACFPVTKISSVQKRINKIYRRRRRQDRAEVNIADVRKAFKGIRNENDDDKSDSHNSDGSNVSKPESENEYFDENSNICTEKDERTGDASVSAEQQTDNSTENTGCIVINKTMKETSDDLENPTPKRKTSIQVRAWELSRRLRQRRREKRKGFTESPLI
ncbi:hypothetical protein ACF0H5_015457 [Mactra antiquata]